MKKVFSFLIFLLGSGVSSQAQNLQNSGFEEGNQHWVLSGGAAIVTEEFAVPVPAGNYYAGQAVSSGAGVTGAGYQRITGNTSSLCQVRALATTWDTRDHENSIRWQPNARVEIGLDPTGAAAVGGGVGTPASVAHRWVRFQTPRVSGCGETVTVWFRASSTGGILWQFAYFDDFEFLKNPPPNRFASFNIETFPGPFYSTYQGAGFTLNEPGLETPGADGTSKALVATPFTEATSESWDTTWGSFVGTFLFEGPPSDSVDVQGWIRCPGEEIDGNLFRHWMELAWKTGRHSAFDFDSNHTTWNIYQKFDGYTPNAFMQGNNNNWTEYTDQGTTDENGEITMGVKLGNGGSGGIDPENPNHYLAQSFAWDEIGLVPVSGPIPPSSVDHWSLFY